MSNPSSSAGQGKAIHLAPMTFRVKPDERKLIRREAMIAGMTVGSYIRSRLLEAPQTQTIYKRTELRRLIMRLIGHIGRVGNNMNQIAWKLNTDQPIIPIDNEFHKEGVTALKDMRVLLINFLLHNHFPC